MVNVALGDSCAFGGFWREKLKKKFCRAMLVRPKKSVEEFWGPDNDSASVPVDLVQEPFLSSPCTRSRTDSPSLTPDVEILNASGEVEPVSPDTVI